MAVDQSSTKTCTRCGKSKAMQYFSMRADRTNAPRSICKECCNLLSAEWRKNNKERQNELTRIWVLNNKERVREHNKAWRKDNKDKIRDWSRDWYLKNTDKAKASSANWLKNNPDAKRVIVNNYRLKKKSTGKLSNDISSKLLLLQKNKCACCGKNLRDKYHLDHIIPISRGGKNIDSNIQLLCVTCNLTKGAKHPIDFMRSLGFLI